MAELTTGPFGIFEKGSSGHILNALYEVGIPINIVENIRFGDPRGLLLNAEVFANYKYFTGIDQPLFRFQNPGFGQQRMAMREDGSCKPEFHLSLSVHDRAALIIRGPMASPELHEFICGMLTNWITDPRYELHQASGAFFQGGHSNPLGEYIYIEFLKPSGAEAFVDYLNQNFVQSKD